MSKRNAKGLKLGRTLGEQSLDDRVEPAPPKREKFNDDVPKHLAPLSEHSPGIRVTKFAAGGDGFFPHG
jgi:hypothetical protein